MSLPIASCPNCGYDATTLQSCLYIAPSPFKHLFDSQTPREEIRAAASQIKSFTDEMRSEIDDLEARVARLRETLRLAEQHHARAKYVLSAHVMLNPPIESLPAEVLSYIFSLTFEKPFYVFDMRPQVPWLLGQVCRSWRALALQTPTLWNSFKGINSQKWNLIYMRRLEEVLDRSGNSALHVSLDALMPLGARILARHASRLSELEVACWFATLYVFRASPEMSILTKLCVTVQGPVDPPPAEHVSFDIASKAPRLTHVDLNMKWVSIDIPRVFLLPWPQITHLTLQMGQDNYRHIFHILSQCRNLVSLTDDGVSQPYTLQAPSHTYVLPHLTFLDVRSPLILLPYMQCPALQTFTLRGALYTDVELSETDWENFLAFADRSRCTLQKVSYIHVRYLGHKSEHPAPVQKLLSFVSHVPTVVVTRLLPR